MDQKNKIQTYTDLLIKWNASYNLISYKSIDDLMINHIIDSMSLLELGTFKNETIYDIGPGPGLPGIVLSIVMPENKYILVEPKKKYYRFLKKAVRNLDLNHVEIHNNKVEVEQNIQKTDIIISRAVSGLDFFLNLNNIPTGTRIIFFTGKDTFNRINSVKKDHLEIIHLKKIKILEKYYKSHYIMAVKK